MTQAGAECVKVILRCRPMSEKEEAHGRERVVDMDLSSNMVSVRNPKDMREAPKNFTFDKIYNWNSMQEDIFVETAQPIVEQVIGGFNGTIFAYGQTGTGKTFTMQGLPDAPESKGILPRTFRWIFEACEAAKAAAPLEANAQFLVRASYLEIYNEEIHDLLAKDRKKKLELKESADGGVYVKDLSQFVLGSVDEIEHVFAVGSKNRQVGDTLMNDTSSRSHSIFTLVIESSTIGIDGQPHLKTGKLHLVDLAGSERVSKTGATGARALEGIKINLSLTSLGNVINALVDGRSTHIPYRDSKLTRLLQDSLGGNAKTVMIANLGPADYNYDETLSTLRYANRAKMIKNKPRVNEDPKDTMLREFQAEVERLRAAAADLNQQPTHVIEERGMTKEEVETIFARERAEMDRQKAEREAARERAANAAQQRRAEAMTERRRKHEMAEQLAKMQAQVNAKVGNVESIKRAVEEGAEQTERMEREIERRERTAEQRRQEAEALQQAAYETEHRFGDLRAVAEQKTRELEGLRRSKDQEQLQWLEQQEQIRAEREVLLQQMREHERQLKLHETIIESFIASDVVESIKSMAMWNEQCGDDGDWVLAPLAPLIARPTNAWGESSSPRHRPLCEYARQQQQQGQGRSGCNPRFKHDNILDGILELDRPERTTQDYYYAPDDVGMDILSREQYAEYATMMMETPGELERMAYGSGGGRFVH